MAKRARRKAVSMRKPISLGNKIHATLRNMFVFLVLFLASYLFYKISSTDLFLNLFGLLSIIFGFLTLAFFVVLMVFLVLKSGKK
jgi:uncharacterized membrane protein YdbT with pleckstrin-like domain